MVTLTNRPTNLEGDYRAICLFEGSEIEGRDLQIAFMISVWVHEVINDSLRPRLSHSSSI